MSSRTPNSILKRKQAQEQAAAVKRHRQKGRRVSFAPDEDLVTTQLYELPKHTPSPLAGSGPAADPHGEQPLSEVQNASHPPAAAGGSGWATAKLAPPPAFQRHLVENSPGMFQSPMSMELTNDTLQDGTLPAFNLARADEDSLQLGMDNLTGVTCDVPGLSAIIEDYAEGQLDATGSVAAGTQYGDEDADMELTNGTTGAMMAEALASLCTPLGQQVAQASPGRYATRSASKAAAASPGTAAQLAGQMVSPGSAAHTRSRRRSSGGGTSPGVTPSPLRRMTRSASKEGVMAISPVTEAPPAAGATAGVDRLAVAPAPSPGGRQGRSSRGGRRSSLQTDEYRAAAQRKWGMVPGDEDSGGLSPLPELGPAAPGMGGQPGRGRRSSTGVVLAQRSKWGFAPGAETEDTLDLRLDGRGRGLGEATLHNVYSEGVGTGEVTLAVRQGALRSGGGADQDAEEPAADEVPPAGVQHADPPGAARMPGGLHGLGLDSPTTSAGSKEGGLEGMTTRLLLDEEEGREDGGGGGADQREGAWMGLSAAGAAAARPSLGTTGRGSVGSNMPTANLVIAARGGDVPTQQLLAGLGATTQLLADTSHQGGGLKARSLVRMGSSGPGAAGLLTGGLDTSHLLVDATGASCSMPALLARHQQALGGAAAMARAQHMMAAADAVDASVELQGLTGQHGSQGQHSLEDVTLDDFARPPELANGQGGELHTTLPFSGAFSQQLEPVSASKVAQLPPISFQDFLQVVDMQFLDHIRRGTSINQVDLAPGPDPRDLQEALALLTLTGSEVAVVEGAIGRLQQAMRDKRTRNLQLEQELSASNPRIFQLAQTVRGADLEGLKHALVLLKKGCRADTGAAWKALRCDMERQLSARLATQQQELSQHLQFVQAKLLRAEQQVAFAEEFAGEARRGLQAADARQAELAASKRAVRYSRGRLAELRWLNQERQTRHVEVEQQAAALQARKQALDTDADALRARLAALKVAAVATPVRGTPVADQLVDSMERLSILSGLQDWRLKVDGTDGWCLDYQGRLSCQLAFSGAADARLVQGVVRVAPAGAGLSDVLLPQLVATLPASFSLPAAHLQRHLVPLSARLARCCEVADALASCCLAWRLLAGVSVKLAAGQLRLNFLDADREVKLAVYLRLSDVLVPKLRTGISYGVDVLAADSSAGGRSGLQAMVQQAVMPLLAPFVHGNSCAQVLKGVCQAVTGVLCGSADQLGAARTPEAARHALFCAA